MITYQISNRHSALVLWQYGKCDHGTFETY